MLAGRTLSDLLREFTWHRKRRSHVVLFVSISPPLEVKVHAVSNIITATFRPKLSSWLTNYTLPMCVIRFKPAADALTKNTSAELLIYCSYRNPVTRPEPVYFYFLFLKSRFSQEPGRNRFTRTNHTCVGVRLYDSKRSKQTFNLPHCDWSV